MGSNPTQGIDICIVHVYSVCTVLCVVRSHVFNQSPVEGVLPTVYEDQETEKAAKAQYRTVEP
jgi:hypothetical protein